MNRLAWLMPVLFVVLVPAAPATAQQALYRPDLTAADIETCLRTDWYGVYFKNKKIGYFRAGRERTQDGLRETVAMSLKLFSFGQKAEMKITQDLTFAAKAPHELVSGSYEESAGPGTTKFTYQRTGPKAYDVLQTVGRESRKRAVNDLDYTFADSLATEVWIRRNPALGDEITSRDFEPKDQKIEKQWSKILDAKKTLVGGVDVRIFELKSKSSQDQIEVTSRHDGDGKMLSGWIAGTFELRLETEEQAKNTEYSQDLFVLGMAKCDKAIGPMRKVQELVVVVDGGPAVFEDGPRQRATMVDGKLRLEIGKRFGKEVKATKEEIDEATGEDSTHHIKHPKVKELAEQAVGDARTDLEKVRNIVKFVNGYIRPSYANAMPTIHDLIQRKTGDCKSYALMFTNLARAAGLPAREVSGLLYVGDDQKAFGGHAWNEVVLNGVWVPIDATFNETEVNATHLCFGTEKRAAKNLLETLGKLQLKVIEVNGK
jgi:hypothetical protein